MDGTGRKIGISKQQSVFFPKGTFSIGQGSGGISSTKNKSKSISLRGQNDPEMNFRVIIGWRFEQVCYRINQ